jgi:hypothetical protein
MLDVYVRVLDTINQHDRAGQESTNYSLAKETNISRYKLKKILRDLQDFDFTFEVKRLHRKPDVYKSIYHPTMRGSTWLSFMQSNRML